MYTECRDYLVEKLKAAGIKMTPITSMKRLRVYGNSHVGAVIPDEDNFEFNGSKRRYRDSNDKGHKRMKLYDRTVTFAVIIGDYSADKVDEILQRFLEQAGSGLYVNGNFVNLDILSAEWAEEDDSILNAKVAVNLEVQFRGGVYTDTELTRLPGDISVRVEKVSLNREEQTNGKK